MLLVTYHGGTKGRNNIDLIAHSGFVAKKVLEHDDTVKLDELRGLAWGPDGELWVVNGAKTTSQVLRFKGDRGSYSLTGVAVSGADYDAISHPFDIAFAPDGAEWFVSNQDTNVVAGPMPSPPEQAPYLAGEYPQG